MKINHPESRIEQEGIINMRSILEEFAYGNISPETQSFKRNSQLGRAMESLRKNEEQLLALLNDDEKALLEKYIDAQGEINSLTAAKNLVYGYKLGVLITAEAFITSDEIVIGEDPLY
jgi:hypothetical protein